MHQRAREIAEFALAPSVLNDRTMTNIEPTSIDSADLLHVTGGRQLVEGIRQTFNAGAIALSIMNPTAPPVPRIPSPPTIVRPAPIQPSISSGK